jgi:hypothetical protein
MHWLRGPLQCADIMVGNPAKVPDVAGSQSRPRHQRRGRNKAVQGFNAVAGAELSDSGATRESTSITASMVNSASILATARGVRCG